MQFLALMTFSVPFWQIPSAANWPETCAVAFRLSYPDVSLDLTVKDDTGLAGMRTYQAHLSVEASESAEAAQLLENVFGGISGISVYHLSAEPIGGQPSLDLGGSVVPSEPSEIELPVVCVVSQSQQTIAQIWAACTVKPAGARINILENRGGACKLTVTFKVPLSADRAATTEELTGLIDRIFGVASEIGVCWPESDSASTT